MSSDFGTLKCKIKLWETRFAETNLRKPTKADIKGSEIEEAYVQYGKLKLELSKTETREPNNDVWSPKFNKAAQSTSTSSKNGPNFNSKFKSIFTNKLWRSSLEMAQNTSDKGLKSPVLNVRKEVEVVPITEENSENDSKSRNTSAHPVLSKTESYTANDDKLSDTVLNGFVSTKWSAPNSKFAYKPCDKRSRLSSGRLKNAEVDVKWLEKCIFASEAEDKDSEDAGNISNSTSHPYEREKETRTLNNIGQALHSQFNASEDHCAGFKNKTFSRDLDNAITKDIPNVESFVDGEETTTFVNSHISSVKNTDIIRSPSNNDFKKSPSHKPLKNSPDVMPDIVRSPSKNDSEKLSSNKLLRNSQNPNVENVKDVAAHKCSKIKIQEFEDVYEFKDTDVCNEDVSTIGAKPALRSALLEASKPGGLEAAQFRSKNTPAMADVNVIECEGENTKPKPAPKKRKVSPKDDEFDCEDNFSKPKAKRIKSDCVGGGSLVSENFVKINIKRKKFTKGPNRMKSRQYKKMMWKKKKWASSGGKCFSCGEAGHWANNCPKKNESLLNEAALDEAKKSNVNEEPNKDQNVCEKDAPLQKEAIPSFTEEYISDKVQQYLKKFKHKKFRQFQEQAIFRILSGRSTLLVLPTGSGKSLCYQIPACVYAENNRCISLVISPLVSLMEDQIKNHPAFLSSVCLHSGLTPAQRQHTLERLKSGDAKVLLIAPESLLAMHAFFKSALPSIAFACIDEAHCLSEWSHNFRPSYLQVLKVLKSCLGVGCILGLSATVTKGTTNRICCLLDIDPEEAVFGETSIPTNLLLSISREKDKEQALLDLLESERYRKLASVIVYCTRRETTERLATLIRIHFQNTSQIRKDKKLEIDVASVAAYHAGLSAAQRRTTQKNFMKGKLRIIIATVAFGMGLDKADVRSVIHYDLPKSFEGYVQEIGRAGRDSQAAFCHLFLQPQANDLQELRRHIYSNSVDRVAIRKLLNRVFLPQQLPVDHNNSKDNDRRQVAIPIEDVVQELDLNKEIIETLICYLELHPGKWFEVLPVINNSCNIKSYGGPEQLNRTILNCKAVNAAQKLSSTTRTTSNIAFSLVEVCSAMGWDCELVRKELRNLQFASVNGSWHRTGLIVEFSNPSFHICMSRDLSSEQKDQLLNFLHEINTQQERKELRKLHSLFNAFKRYSRSSFVPEEDEVEVSDGLKNVLCDYFRDSHISSQDDVPSQPYSEDEIRREISSFLDIYHENRFTAMQIARIFYGIGSPQYPTEVWGKVRRFWRSFIYVDFPNILSVARQELLRLRS